MSSISLRLPDSLHETARELAKKDHISINRLVATALAEKISALMTQDYLEERAKRGRQSKFDRAMAKVSKTEPEQFDRL